MAIFQVIKFDSPQRVLVWKHPKENITSGSQLVVGPAQMATFVREGQICDLFESGTYTLDTDNLPILSILFNLPFGQYGVSVQHPGLFLEKLVGTAHAHTTDDLIHYFRGLVGSRVTDELSTALTEEGISFVEASARIAKLSEHIAQRL